MSEARRILDERLAKGEINLAEYDKLVAILGNSASDDPQPTTPKPVQVSPASTDASVYRWNEFSWDVVTKNPTVQFFMGFSILIVALMTIPQYSKNSTGICLFEPCRVAPFFETITRDFFVIPTLWSIIMTSFSIFSAVSNSLILKKCCLAFLAVILLWNLRELSLVLQSDYRLKPETKLVSLLFVCLPATLGAMVFTTLKNSKSG